MILKINIQSLKSNLLNQLQFIDRRNINDTKKYISNSIDEAFDKLNYCFKHISHEAYNDGKHTFFSPLFSDQNLIFLWFLSKCIWVKTQNEIVCNKVYYLNKMLHSFDCNYKTNLPNIFFVAHGVGIVLGKASYSDFFLVSQNCTVGANKKKYPIISKKVSLGSGASIIGDCKVGEESSIGSGTQIFEQNVKSNMFAMRDKTGKLVFKKNKKPLTCNFFIY